MLSGLQITRRFSDGTGIYGVSVSLAPGEAKVVMGPSGAGKTTLLRVLALLDKPDQGILELDGQRFQFPTATRSDPRWEYPIVSLVFQQLFLWPHLTNRTNLELPLRRSFMRERLDGLIDRLEITALLDKYPNQSSLGQRQRVAIARALALQPRYLLLDEATSALDRLLACRVAELLRERVSGGMGLLVVTHDPAFADTLGGARLWMERGLLMANTEGLVHDTGVYASLGVGQ